MKKIMFICSGNTCRSPLAEGLFKKYLKDNNIDSIDVSSAGVNVFPGDEVDVRMALVAISKGIDISLHRARKVNPEHIMTTDLFVCLNDECSKALAKQCDKNKIMTFDISDPYNKSVEKYESCCKELQQIFPEVLHRIKKAVRIREMAESDISEIAELEKICFSTPWSENALREELTLCHLQALPRPEGLTKPRCR